MSIQFKPAVRTQRLLRLALIGPAGSGKSLSALKIARGLAGPEGKVAAVDTENYSLSLYANQVKFDSVALTTFAPSSYIACIQAAAAAGYNVLVIDSLSHAWSGKDGALEQVDKRAGESSSGNSYVAWRQVTPMHNAMVEAMIQCRMHLIVTMRTKTEYVQEKDDKGKTKIRKLGLAPIQREGLEYEFDVVGDMHNAVLTVGKTRCSSLHEAVIAKPSEQLGSDLIEWLNSGAIEEPVARTTEPEQRPAVQRQEPKPATAAKVETIKLSGNGEGEREVVEVKKIKSSPPNVKDPWDLYKVVLRAANYQVELATLSKSIADKALLAMTHNKPAMCKWELDGKYQNLLSCEPIGVPVPTESGQRSKSIRDIVGTKDQQT